MLIRRVTPCAALLVLVACSYSAEVRKSVQRVLKQDFGKYHFFATPAGNFGVGTMYLKSANTTKPAEVSDEALIAVQDTYFRADVGASEREQLLEKIFPHGEIGRWDVNEKLTQGVTLDVAVPGIGGALTGSGSLDLKKGVDVELHAGETTVRKMNWIELRRARDAQKIADDIVRHLDARDVMIAMNDVIVRGYRAVVKIDAAVNATLKAELEKAAAGAPVSLPSGKTTFSRGQNGTYEINVADPVVVAILFKEIPVGAQSAADSDTWPAATVDALLIERLREKAAKLRR